MLDIYDKKERDILNKKVNSIRLQKEKNISYQNIFNNKIIKINILKGDNSKIDNKELETKLHISINKKKIL